MLDTIELALTLLKQWEGCKLTAYIDQGGRVTIGWGHTGGIQMGDTWTQIEADRALQEDLEAVYNGCTKVIKVALNPNQMAAILSFTYNLGIGNFTRSSLLKFINAGLFEKASEQFALWDRIGLYKSQGLASRREAERELFIKEYTYEQTI